MDILDRSHSGHLEVQKDIFKILQRSGRCVRSVEGGLRYMRCKRQYKSTSSIVANRFKQRTKCYMLDLGAIDRLPT